MFPHFWFAGGHGHGRPGPFQLLDHHRNWEDAASVWTVDGVVCSQCSLCSTALHWHWHFDLYSFHYQTESYFLAARD